MKLTVRDLIRQLQHQHPDNMVIATIWKKTIVVGDVSIDSNDWETLLVLQKENE